MGKLDGETCIIELSGLAAHSFTEMRGAGVRSTVESVFHSGSRVLFRRALGLVLLAIVDNCQGR